MKDKVLKDLLDVLYPLDPLCLFELFWTFFMKDEVLKDLLYVLDALHLLTLL